MAGKKKASITEADLYQPICDYLTRQGYTVHAEVNGCDVAACKGDEVIIVEMKRHFSVDLLLQATDRQEISDSVYVALPGPAGLRRSKRWRGIRRLLRRLELGLVLVNLDGEPAVEIALHPGRAQRRRLKRRKRALLREIEGRSGDYNRGGSSRQKIVTAYRESAIEIACYLRELGPLSPHRLRALGTGRKTQSILYANHYGWFERLERGIYALSSQGKEELASYPELVQKYEGQLQERLDSEAECG